MNVDETSGPNRDAGWLQRYIKASVANNLCTQVSCGTCGAMDFRKGLLRALSDASGTKPVDTMDRTRALAITVELGHLTPAQEATGHEAAVRVVVYDVSSTLGEVELVRLLNGTWAGGLLARMHAHHRERLERQTAHAMQNNPASVEKMRKERRRAKQENHLARVAAKLERDHAWREKQKKPEA